MSAVVPRRADGPLGWALRRRESGVALATIAVLIAATALNPAFLFSADGLRNLLLGPSLLILLAVAQAIVLITKHIDLSLSATLGLSAYATGRMFADWPGVPPLAVILLGILLGAALGAVNGLLVTLAKVPSLVITLGTLSIISGLTIAWAGSDRITPSDLPPSFTAIGSEGLFGIPWLFLIALAVVLVAAYVLGETPAGRSLYAIGSDALAARLYGLRVSRTVFLAFLASGAIAGLAGVLYAARFANVSAGAGSGMELGSLAAAVIGGVAVFGGRGTVVGAALGAVMLTLINRALPSIGVVDLWQQAVVGALIIGAIILDHLLARRTERRLAQVREFALETRERSLR